MKKITLSPLTRIEGHMAVHTEAEEFTGAGGKVMNRIVRAECHGEMFRGFEQILRGRDPLDAQQFTQRICGICPIPHGLASIRAQEMAYGLTPTPNGRLLQNLIAAGNLVSSHILHFYHLSALDFVDVTAVLRYTGRDRNLLAVKSWVESQQAQGKQGALPFPAAPFLPRQEGDYLANDEANCMFVAHYLEALEMRRIADEMTAVFGAKIPHSTAIVPGGVTQAPTLERILSYRSRLDQIQSFLDGVYAPDVLAAAGAFPQYWEVGGGYPNFLAFGGFEMDDSGTRLFPAGTVVAGQFQPLDTGLIAEEVGHSRYSSGSKLHPSKGETTADPRKAGAYSWLKAPRYQGQPMEVGPLARLLVAYHGPSGGDLKGEVDKLLAQAGIGLAKLHSVMGRHLARLVETRRLVAQMYRWLDELDLDQPPAADFKIPREGEGWGLVEAARGALGHWITIRDHRIERYQCMVPTTWNCSPRDDAGVPGPLEKALEGVIVANAEQPIEVGRVVRSFDPCLACAIH